MFVFVWKKCHCSSILLFWRELWNLTVATAELKSDKHSPNSRKMNNRKFFFERYLIFNYLSNFSTWTWADRISFCCIWGDSVVLCFFTFTHARHVREATCYRERTFWWITAKDITTLKCKATVFVIQLWYLIHRFRETVQSTNHWSQLILLSFIVSCVDFFKRSNLFATRFPLKFIVCHI